MKLLSLLLALCMLNGQLLLTGEFKVYANEPMQSLSWKALPDLPDSLGVAGPYVGTDNGVLIVAGGANFPEPVWENAKQWHRAIWVLREKQGSYEWVAAGELPGPCGYGAVVSIEQGLLCMGGNDANSVLRECFLLNWDEKSQQVEVLPAAPLPEPNVYGQAARIGNYVYLACGQKEAGLDSATKTLWRMDLSHSDDPQKWTWEKCTEVPGEARALHVFVAQKRGADDCLYLMSGRSQRGDEVLYLQDNWEYTPRTDSWRQLPDLPACVMAGPAIALDSNQILILGGDDGQYFLRADELRDNHPGFPRKAYLFNNATEQWKTFATNHENQVTTSAVRWQGKIIIPSGEVRPRVRTPHIWQVIPSGE
ncbi:MAG: hypothetical protein KDA78_09080 [Planctomycetaceae bacterium]|nr:hypothetical protein [Planctomycetaceae bacterium]